jgi:hypothetical protein
MNDEKDLAQAANPRAMQVKVKTRWTRMMMMHPDPFVKQIHEKASGCLWLPSGRNKGCNERDE